MKINLEIPDSLLTQIELLSKLTGLSVESIMHEALWREAHGIKRFVQEYMEKDYLDNESKNCINLLRHQ